MIPTDEQPVHASQLWLSADVAKARFDASCRATTAERAQPADIRKMKGRVFDRTAAGAREFIEWGESLLAPDQQLCVIMEATGHYSLELVAWLLSVSPSLRIAVIRPKLIKDYASSMGLRNKTDQIDARVLACYGVERRPESATRQSEVFLSLRAVGRLRLALQEQITANSNRLEMLSAEHHAPGVRKLLVRSQKAVLKALEKESAVLDKALKELVESDPELKRQVARVTSIAGVGELTAYAVLGELGDLRLYDSSRQLTAFAGLNPRVSKSGTVEKKMRISKQGSPRVRRALYMASMACVRHNERISKRRDHLLGQGKTKMTAMVANMRTLLVIMRALVVADVDYDPSYLERCGIPVGKPVDKLTA